MEIVSKRLMPGARPETQCNSANHTVDGNPAQPSQIKIEDGHLELI